MRVGYVDLVAQHGGLRERLTAAFERVLAHGQFILGPEVRELEDRLARYLGVPHVVTCGSGTDAIVLALRLRGIGAGDEVITVAHSFIATANAIALVGATPVFVDIDEETMVMDPACAAEAVTQRTKAVIPVHLNGFPCDPDPLLELCATHRLSLIEDCAQAFGARRRGRSVGAADLGCFSLHPLKALAACGDGGFITVQGESDAERLRQLRNHGLIDRDRCAQLGLNSRLDTLLAALLLVKLDYIDEWLRIRRAHARAYRDALRDRVRLPPEPAGCEPSYCPFVIRHSARDHLAQSLARRGVDARIHYPIAIDEQEAYRAAPACPLPVTRRVIRQILSLPSSADLGEAQRDHVIDSVVAALAELEA